MMLSSPFAFAPCYSKPINVRHSIQPSPSVLSHHSSFTSSSPSTNLNHHGHQRRQRHISMPSTTTTTTKRTATASWQDSLLPPDPLSPPLSTLYNRFPRTYSHLFVLGINAEQDTVYMTSHVTTPKSPDRVTRPPYAISSDTLPIPLAPPLQSSAALMRDLFGFLYATPCAQDRTFLSRSASLVSSLLPTSLYRHLQLDNIRANDIMYQLAKSEMCKLMPNRVAVILNILELCDARIAAGAIVETAVSGTNLNSNAADNSIVLDGVLYVETCMATLYGEKVFNEPVAVRDIDPCFTVALANATETPCFIDNHIFKCTSVRVARMTEVFSSFGYRPVQLMDSLHSEAESTDSVNENNDTSGGVKGLWQLTAEDALALTDTQMRDALRRQSVAVRNNESRTSMMGKLIEFMDEVHRREVLITMAAQQEIYSVAGELQKGRSKRGKLLAQLKQAERDENWIEVTRIAGEMKRLEQKTHDITAEPGSYNPDLDQDDWYQPCR